MNRKAIKALSHALAHTIRFHNGQRYYQPFAQEHIDTLGKFLRSQNPEFKRENWERETGYIRGRSRWHNVAPSGSPSDHPSGNMSDTLDRMIAWENGVLSDDATIRLFQDLVDSGMAWSLQGMYGRQAASLIKAGLVRDTHHVITRAGSRKGGR